SGSAQGRRLRPCQPPARSSPPTVSALASEQRLELGALLNRREDRVFLQLRRPEPHRDARKPRDRGVAIPLLHARARRRDAEVAIAEPLPFQLLELPARRRELAVAEQRFS